jgi:hypothetical protein
MDIRPATTRVIKAGKSEHPFLLFFGRRKSEENEPGSLLSGAIISFVLTVAAIALGVCLYAFLTGTLR